jgi:hypothetical protein
VAEFGCDIFLRRPTRRALRQVDPEAFGIGRAASAVRILERALYALACSSVRVPTARATGDATGGAAVPLVRMEKAVDPSLLG